MPELAPGERATVEARVRGPIPPGRYRFALDLVAEHRAWFSELGTASLAADVDVLPRGGLPHAELPGWVEPAPDAGERIAAAHAEGYAVVAGAVEWLGGFGRRRPRALAPYEPGPGRIPNFPHPLLCPSVLDGLELERLGDVGGLPAFAAPSEEPGSTTGGSCCAQIPGAGRDRRRQQGPRVSFVAPDAHDAFTKSKGTSHRSR